jgi:recombination protein RecA
MAKEKVENTTPMKPIDAVTKKITDKYGEGILINATNVLDEPQQIIPISPKLDLITGGGIPEGSWLTLTGKRKCGKTTLALHIASICQRPEYGGRHVYYLDIEGRLKKMNLRGIANLDMSKFHRIRSKKGKIMSGQEFLQAGEDILKTHEKCVLIIDSYSQICHEKEMNEGIGGSTRGAGGYQLLAQFCRQLANVVPVMDSIVIGITHLMANPTGYGAPLQEKGGNAIEYQGDIKLKAKSVEYWRVGGDTGPIIGQKITWLCEWAALCGPGGEIDGYLRYGKGIDELYERIDIATDLGIIEKKSSWFVLNFLPEPLKIQGQDNLYKLLLEHPDWIATITKQMNAMVGK